MTGNDVLEPRYLKHGLRQELVIQGQVTDAFFFLVEVSILQWVLVPPVMPVVAENFWVQDRCPADCIWPVRCASE